MDADELMILGKPASGKTHYGGQLYGRLQRQRGVLTLQSGVGTPKDLSLFEDVLKSLQNGQAAEHTSAATWDKVTLPLQTRTGRRVNVAWPDYAGEQVTNIFKTRRAPTHWQERLRASSGWVLLIRLNAETTYPDALEELLSRGERTATAPAERDEARLSVWDANAMWVELMQLLLHVAGIGSVRRVKEKRLCVLLSCFDELDVGERVPLDVLRDHLPLFAAYLESVWAPEDLSVWGLSALGQPLDKHSADEGFIDDGPEEKGWVALPDGGARDPDLTLPLAWLLERR